MPDPVFGGMVVGGALVGGIVYLVNLGRRVFRKPSKQLPAVTHPPEDRAEAVRRVLKHLQRKKISELEEGTAAVIVGTVRAISKVPLLTSPAQGLPCLGYHLDVRLLELDMFRMPQVYEAARCVDIDVVDETGTICVASDKLELAITDGTVARFPHMPAFLQPYVPRAIYGEPTLVEEGLLYEGATILVCGVVTREQTATDYRNSTHRFVLRATATFPLVASTDKDLLQAGDRPIAPEELRQR